MLDVLVADDDANVLESISFALTRAGHQVTEAKDGGQALALLASHVFDLAICDVQMPKLDGMTLMRRIRREAPSTCVVLMTSHGRINDVIESLRDGAVDYVTKPFDPDEFTSKVVGPIAQRRSHTRIVEAARARVATSSSPPHLVVASAAMRALVARVSLLAQSDAPVLVTGGRGTGKELIARSVHALSPRRHGPYVVLAGQTLGELLAHDWVELDESTSEPDSWLVEVLGGTLVLDGIDDLPATAQAHLLRIVSEPRFIASSAPGGRPTGLRVITLAQEGFTERARAGDFLGSLYRRLSAAEVHVPSLAEREGDLVPLVKELSRELQPDTDPACEVTADALEALSRYPFPGNVRELRRVLEHALVMSGGGPIAVEHLPAEICG